MNSPTVRISRSNESNEMDVIVAEFAIHVFPKECIPRLLRG